MYYRIRIQGHLDPGWQDRFRGLHLEQQEGGTTLFEGALPDQAALHGVRPTPRRNEIAREGSVPSGPAKHTRSANGTSSQHKLFYDK